MAKKPKRCAFCARSEAEVATMFTAPKDISSVSLCGECVDLLADILEDRRRG